MRQSLIIDADGDWALGTPGGGFMANVQPEGFQLGEGRTYSLGPLTLSFKTTTASYTLFEASGPPGSGASLHRNNAFDQAQIVVDGRCEVRFEDRTIFLGPGDMVFLPKGIVHGLTNLGPGITRLMIITTPAGLLEMFVAEAAAELGGGGGPLTMSGSTETIVRYCSAIWQPRPYH
jgi:quercetin dioxygenase-like cupin family protein